MKLLAYDENSSLISVEKFFSQIDGFVDDLILKQQVLSILGVFLRHPSDIPLVAEKVGELYKFKLGDEKKTYDLYFTYDTTSIRLLTIK